MKIAMPPSEKHLPSTNEVLDFLASDEAGKRLPYNVKYSKAVKDAMAYRLLVGSGPRKIHLDTSLALMGEFGDDGPSVELQAWLSDHPAITKARDLFNDGYSLLDARDQDKWPVELINRRTGQKVRLDKSGKTYASYRNYGKGMWDALAWLLVTGSLPDNVSDDTVEKMMGLQLIYDTARGYAPNTERALSRNINYHPFLLSWWSAYLGSDVDPLYIKIVTEEWYNTPLTYKQKGRKTSDGAFVKNTNTGKTGSVMLDGTVVWD